MKDATHGLKKRRICGLGLAQALACAACLCAVPPAGAVIYVSLDVDGDSKVDFQFSVFTFAEGPYRPPLHSTNVFGLRGCNSRAQLFTCAYDASRAGVVSAGTPIGELPPEDMVWGVQGARLLTEEAFRISYDGGITFVYRTCCHSGSLVDNPDGYVGVRFQMPDGWHYGWMRFKRVETFPDVVFEQAVFHPLPNVPVTAGRDPRPRLVIERTADGVAISWPQEETGFVLERADELATPVWTTVEEVEANRVTLPLAQAAAFFRLRGL